MTTAAEAELFQAMTRLQPGEHLCLVYEDDPAEQMRALLPYIAQTLTAGEQFVYVADDQTVDELRAHLTGSGIDIADAEDRGALLLSTREDWRQPGELDSEKKAEQVRAAIQNALDAGFSGVNFAVEMTWTLGPDIDARKLSHWEAFINTIFTPETPGRIVCQYSRKRLPPEVIRAGLSTHPTVIIRDGVHANPYFEAPLILADDDAATQLGPDSARVDWMLSRVQLMRTLEQERAQRIQAEAALHETEHSKEQMEALFQETLRARAEAQEHADLLTTLDQISKIVLVELDLSKAVQAVTDVATRVTRAQFGAFFYNVTNDEGESYVLYALSGVDRATFERFPMPRNTAIFGPTFDGEGTIRLDDVQADERYGKNAPYHGMPPGHLPVHSYLATPVVARSGEVLGGLFFGHERSGVFTERDEQTIEGIAGQAAIAIENGRLYDEAQQSIQLRDKFLGIASHELKTPLTVFKGYALLLARQLRRGTLDPEQLPGIVDQLVLHSRRLEDLVDDLLDTSRIQHGRLELHPESLDLVALAATVMERFDDEPNHTLILDAPDPVVGIWDPGRIDQVLTNLVGNAVKYSPDGGEVHVSVRETDNEARLSVRDHGIGIARRDQPEVFQPFRRLHADARLITGTGLGLYISSEIVARHGGTINVVSVQGEGSTFTVCLPLYTPAEAAVETSNA